MIVEVPETVLGQVDVQALGRAAFVDYEVAWRVRRDAILDPGNEELRVEVQTYYEPDMASFLLNFLDEYLASDMETTENPARPNTVEFVRAEIAGGEDLVQIVVCEVLADLETNRVTGEVLDEGVIAYTNEVLLVRTEDGWKVSKEGVRRTENGVETCSA